MTRKRKDTQMLQKSQWSLAATALVVGAFLVAAARPAHAQVRIHLTGPVKTTPGTGIILPHSSIGSSVTTTPAPSPVVTPPAPVVKPPVVTPPVVTPPVSSSLRTSTPVITPKPVVNSAPQGFSAGPGLLGEYRLNLGYMVNRVAPDIIGVGGPSVQKVHAHH
jgi:hypothetical protein